MGVTTLTSLDNKDLKMIGHTKSIKNLVIQQARLAKKAKLDLKDNKSVLNADPFLLGKNFSNRIQKGGSIVANVFFA